MNERNTHDSRRLLASLVAVLMVASVFAPIGVAGAQTAAVSVSHANGQMTAAPGETVTITVTFDQTAANSPAMEPALPGGWSITQATAGTGWSWVEQQQTFLGSLSLSGADGVSGTYTHTYTVQVPADAEPGDYTVTSEGSAIAPATGDSVGDTASTTVTVEAPGPGVVGGFENPPADPDGDGLYEDVNGDGTVDVGDAQALFANAGDSVVQSNVGAFDYNGDGSVNVGDAQALFATGMEVGGA